MVCDSRVDEVRTRLALFILGLEEHGYKIAPLLQSDLVEMVVKTLAYFLRTLSSMVRDLYRGDIEEGGFVDTMATLVQEQLTRAWHEGMRVNGLDPETEMEPEWEEQLQEIILNEYNYIDQFAADIVQTAKDEKPWDALLARAELWANRYTDVVNRAVLVTKEQKLKWVYGDTQHCDTCMALNGIVAWASEWELANVVPQSPPNEALDCGGWKCQCSLEPTKERHTPGAFDRIMAAL